MRQHIHPPGHRAAPPRVNEKASKWIAGLNAMNALGKTDRPAFLPSRLRFLCTGWITVQFLDVDSCRCTRRTKG
jgi:hypothetical protein